MKAQVAGPPLRVSGSGSSVSLRLCIPDRFVGDGEAALAGAELRGAALAHAAPHPGRSEFPAFANIQGSG